MRMRLALASCVIGLIVSTAAVAQPAFVNWESAHVSPMTMTPDGSRLLVVNTADDRLEVFSVSPAGLLHTASVPVGLDPVSVRARGNGEAWVANHISDTVSIVDLTTMNVVATLDTDDEPTDVVFAGTTERAFVSCSQANTIMVFNPANLAAAPTRVNIVGEDPRAMAVSADGGEVYVAIFESGNGTTILGGGGTITNGFPPNAVSDPAGPYAGVNPPPNTGGVGGTFDPLQNTDNTAAPAVGLIVRKKAAGAWMDDNGQNWTNLVSGPQAGLSGRRPTWDLVDHDVAIINADTLAVSYAGGMVNIAMALAVHPTTGQVTLVGTDATNEIRFEPVVNGTFIRVNVGFIDPAAPSAVDVVDLNPHLDYSTSMIAQNLRDRSLADPRGIAWNAAGTRGYVSGMGSNNVVVIDDAGDRAGLSHTIEVGEGPTGVVLDENRHHLYVLNKFAGTISIVDTIIETQVGAVALHDPTTAAIKVGRKHLYDTHKNSGLGHIACASCHVDGAWDALAWDLGAPDGDMKSVSDQNCQNGLIGGCEDFHPMKGPMTTQTLKDIIGKEPLHWRGDRDGLEEFNGAFVGLQGDDAMLTTTEMQEFENFLASMFFPPNPFRNLNNTLPTSLPLPGHFTPGRFAAAGAPLPNGNASTGLSRYRTGGLDQGVDCVSCHTLSVGVGSNNRVTSLFPPASAPIASGPNGEMHHALVSVDGSTNISIKIPQTRNMYEKTGFDLTQLVSTRGFGLLHDGSVDSIARFVAEPVFNVSSDADVANLVAFMLTFSGSELPVGSATDPTELPGPTSKDTHAAVGTQVTFDGTNNASAPLVSLLSTLTTLANINKIGIVAKGVQGGIARGYKYIGGNNMQSDRAGEAVISMTNLRLAAADGAEITFTVVPFGTQQRIGVDRDSDTFRDRDELDQCSDPANAAVTPNNVMVDGDANHDAAVNLLDYAVLAGCVGAPAAPAPGMCACWFDFDDDADVDLQDAAELQVRFDAP